MLKRLPFRIAVLLGALAFALVGATAYSRRESGLALRSMARIYMAALALEGYFVDYGRYPFLDSPQAFRALCGPYFPTDTLAENWSSSVSVQVTSDGKHYRVSGAAFEEKPDRDDFAFADGKFVKWPGSKGGGPSPGIGVDSATQQTLLDRGRAHKTMHLMRLLAVGMEAYAVDYNHYPATGNRDEFGRMLSPAYLREVLTADSWGTELLITVSQDGYRIVSAGSDRAFDRKRGLGGPDCRTFSDDAIYENGVFLRSWSSLLQEDGDDAGEWDLVDYEDARARFEAYRSRMQADNLDSLRAERTMSFMRRVGRAIEICPHRSGLTARIGDMKGFIEALSSWANLELQAMDSWQTPWRIVLDQKGAGYRVISAGADRRFDEKEWSKPSVSSDPREDLVYENGHFARSFRLPGQAAKQRPQ
jgi:type II secretory pathway pseudopilin PulG